jgi:uncharacterized RDD family membrane protein YckC
MARASAMPASGSALDNRRVLAALIDLVIIGAGYAVILAAAGKLDAPDAGGALTAVGIGWALYYYFALESGNGQTLGKRVMNIRVADVNGQPAGMREVALRTVLRLIDGLFFYLVGLVVMLATRERRGRLGDLVGGTMIVSADTPAPAPDMSAPEVPAAVSRVPIAESGPAFAEEAPQPVAEPEPVAEAEPEPEVAEPEPEVASPALVELASDVTAVTDDPEREVEPEPEPEIEELPPAATLAAEAAPEEAVEEEHEPRMEELQVAESDELPSAETEEIEVDEDEADEVEADDEDVEVEELEAEADDEVTVKSVETVSAIDLVMEDEEAVAGSRAKGRRS